MMLNARTLVTFLCICIIIDIMVLSLIALWL